MPDENPYMQLVPKGGAQAVDGSNPYMSLVPKGAKPKPPDPLKGVRRGVRQFGRNLNDFGEWASQNPLARGVGAVLGTTERAGESGASWALDKLAGRTPTTNPVKGVLDPEGDMRVTHRLEQQEAPAREALAEGFLRVMGIPFKPGEALNRQSTPAAQTALDFLTQSAHDIQTYIPGWDIFTLLGRAAKFAHAGEAAEAAARAVGKVVPQGVKEKARGVSEHVKSNLTTSHEPLKGATQAGLNVVRSREGGARHLRAQREAQYAGISAQQPGLEALGQTMAAKGLKGLDLRSVHTAINEVPLDQRLALHKANKLTDAALWRDASPEARRAMRARGYKPPAGEENLPTTNLVESDFGRRYVPEQRLYDKAAADEATEARGWSHSRGGVGRSQFNKKKVGAQATDPLYDRFVHRLESSAYLEPKRRAEQSILRDLGLTPSQAPRTDARLDDLRQQLALTPKGSTEYAPLARKIGKYESLHLRQTKQAYEDALKRDKYLRPGAPETDQAISGVLRGEKTAQGIAKRDLAFFGGDASKAFGEEGDLLRRKATGAAGERFRRRRVEAQEAIARQGATKKAVRDLDASLSKLGLSKQKKVEGALGDLRTKQTMLERRNLESLERLAKPKEKAAPETPNIFELPWLSNRKLTEKLPASSPIMKRIAALRDTRAARGGQQYAPLLKALPLDTSKATKRVHGLNDRAASDVERKLKTQTTAADAYRPLVERNRAISAVERGVEQDKLFQGKTALPSPLYERIFGPKVFNEPGFFERGANALQGVVFANPLPHFTGNIAEQQAFAGGGFGTLKRGLGEAIKLGKKDPEALERLNLAKQHGALHEHGYEERIAGEGPFSRFRRATQRPLTLGHEGQASALFDKYVKAGMTHEDAAEEVRKTFGRPHEMAKDVERLKSAGGIFPNWALSTVPRSAKKMFGSAKGRNALKNWARLNEDANADIFEPEYGVEWNPGGFASRAASLAVRPAAYLGGSSLDTSLHDLGTQGKVNGWDVLRDVFPLARPLTQLGGQPLTPAQRARGGYKQLPWWAKAMTLGGSYYTHAETPHHKLIRELKREGLWRQ